MEWCSSQEQEKGPVKTERLIRAFVVYAAAKGCFYGYCLWMEFGDVRLLVMLLDQTKSSMPPVTFRIRPVTVGDSFSLNDGVLAPFVLADWGADAMRYGMQDGDEQWIHSKENLPLW